MQVVNINLYMVMVEVEMVWKMYLNLLSNKRQIWMFFTSGIIGVSLWNWLYSRPASQVQTPCSLSTQPCSPTGQCQLAAHLKLIFMKNFLGPRVPHTLSVATRRHLVWHQHTAYRAFQYSQQGEVERIINHGWNWIETKISTVRKCLYLGIDTAGQKDSRFVGFILYHSIMRMWQSMGNISSETIFDIINKDCLDIWLKLRLH